MTMSLGQFYYWAKQNNLSSLKNKSLNLSKTTEAEQPATSGHSVQEKPIRQRNTAVSANSPRPSFVHNKGADLREMVGLQEIEAARKKEAQPQSNSDSNSEGNSK